MAGEISPLDASTVDSYNYAAFTVEDGSDFLAFRPVLPVGTRAPDFLVTPVGAETVVPLSTYWRESDLVIEFGSLTCPFCALAAPALEAMAEEYVDKGFTFVFVYTREAHPGENYPVQRTMRQKLGHAKAFKEMFDLRRPILVDDLAGTGHRLYGTLPNMTYLISRGGTVLFRSDWTDPPTLKMALDYVLDARTRRREGSRLAPFYAELVGYRWNSNEKFEEGLHRAGPQALEDVRRTRDIREKTGPRPGAIVLQDQ